MTKPTAGVPHHPVVTSTTVEHRISGTPPEQYSAQLLARMVASVDHVDVGAIVSAYLNEHVYSPEDYEHDGEFCESCRWKYGPRPEAIAQEALVLTALVETVLDEAKKTIRKRMSADLAATLIPRLKGTR